MNLDDVIRNFSVAGHNLPRASMRWALDHWEVAEPRFVELLSQYADGVDRSEATRGAVFFVIHLLGERRDGKAFPALCRLLEDAAVSEKVLGDAVTETLRGILIGTYDGDAGALKRVIESTTADEFARAAALDTMSYLTRAGALTDDEMRSYLLHLHAEMQPQADCFIWTAWAIAVAHLGYREYAGKVEDLIRRGLISAHGLGMKDFNEKLRQTLDDPKGLEGFLHDQFGPFANAIGTLSSWYVFSEQFKLDLAERDAPGHETAARPLVDEPLAGPQHAIGRNDPCPCGSGKKYKKCCMPR